LASSGSRRRTDGARQVRPISPVCYRNPKIVVPGQPCASILYLKVDEAPPFGARMPLDGPPFWTEDEIQRLHDWIAEGAGDN